MDTAKNESRSLRGAIYKLITIVSNRPEQLLWPQKGSALWMACQMISQASGVNLTTADPFCEDLTEILRDSTLRSRSIRLTNSWQQENHGPLLAFRSRSNQPIALIYDAAKGYYSIDPVAQTKEAMDEKLAADLEPKAYQFFPLIPEQEFGISAFMSYALQGGASDYFLLFLAGLLAVVVAFFFPIGSKVLFDQVLPNYNLPLYTQVIFGLLIAAISTAIFTFVRNMIQLRWTGIVQHRLQIILWDRLLKLPPAFFRQIPSGDLFQRTNILAAFSYSLSGTIIRSFFTAFFGLAYLLVMFYFNVPLSLMGTSVVLFSALFAGSLGWAALPYKRKLQALRGEINGFLTELVKGIEKVRVAGAESRIFAHWAKRFEQQERIHVASRRLETIIIVVNAILQIMTVLLIFWVAIEQLKQNSLSLTIGTFIAFMAAFVPFSQAVFAFFDQFIFLTALVPFWERIKPIWTSPIENRTGKLQHEELTGAIRLEKLSYRYAAHTPKVIDNISIEIPAGQFAALVGPSGSGKSTLCRLLMAFEEPTEGMIFYDGKQIDFFDPLKLRRQVGALLQENSIFAGTIHDNLICGETYTQTQLKRALELSTFNLDLEQMPHQLDTILFLGGKTMSRGQRQRLLLARVLLREPKILILDEATNSLDNLSQQQIFKNLKTLPITRIVIAHRLSALELVDRIYVIEKGRIAASLTFDQFQRQKYTHYI